MVFIYCWIDFMCFMIFLYVNLCQENLLLVCAYACWIRWEIAQNCCLYILYRIFYLLFWEIYYYFEILHILCYYIERLHIKRLHECKCMLCVYLPFWEIACAVSLFISYFERLYIFIFTLRECLLWKCLYLEWQQYTVCILCTIHMYIMYVCFN